MQITYRSHADHIQVTCRSHAGTHRVINPPLQRAEVLEGGVPVLHQDFTRQLAPHGINSMFVISRSLRGGEWRGGEGRGGEGRGGEGRGGEGRGGEGRGGEGRGEGRGGEGRGGEERGGEGEGCTCNTAIQTTISLKSCI